ncbi:Gustatory receptor 129a [Halyomorpha halys]|nr:Gustatory receptor 129a [Halyomorpha halys]
MDIKKIKNIANTGTIATTSVDDAFRTLFKMLRIFGLFPIDNRFQLVQRLFFISIVFFIFLISTTVFYICTDDLVLIMYGSTHRIIYNFRKLAETVSYFVILCQFCLKREKLLLVLDNLKTVESLLAPLNEKWTWSLHPIQYLGNIALTFFLYLVKRSTIPNDLEITIRSVLMNIDLILSAVFVNHFCAFLDLIRYSLSRAMTCNYYSLYPKLYCLIYDSCEILNDIYGVMILPVLVVDFVGLHHQIYQLLSVCNKPPMFSFSIVVCGIYYGTLVLQIIFSSNVISLETKKFNNYIYNYLVESKFTEMPTFDDLLLHFDRTKEFQFTANGFFLVNTPILCSMILTGTTYLVILLQYSGRSTYNT